MPNYNKFIVIGHLLRDPSLKFIGAKNTACCECGIATNYKRGSVEDVLYMDFTIFGKSAEAFNQYMGKGRAVLLEGRLKTEQWEGKDGGKRSATKMIVDNFTFLGGKDDGGRGSSSSATASTYPPADDSQPF